MFDPEALPQRVAAGSNRTTFRIQKIESRTLRAPSRPFGTLWQALRPDRTGLLIWLQGPTVHVIILSPLTSRISLLLHTCVHCPVIIDEQPALLLPVINWVLNDQKSRSRGQTARSDLIDFARWCSVRLSHGGYLFRRESLMGKSFCDVLLYFDSCCAQLVFQTTARAKRAVCSPRILKSSSIRMDESCCSEEWPILAAFSWARSVALAEARWFQDVSNSSLVCGACVISSFWTDRNVLELYGFTLQRISGGHRSG